MSTTTNAIDNIVQSLSLLVGEGSVAEVRVLGVSGRNRTDSGYFDDFTAAAKAVVPYCRDKRTKGCYVVLNQINPDLLARAANRMQQWTKQTTSDHDIQSRKWIYIDCDPVRPSGISASEAEVDLAINRGGDIRDWLMDNGFCDPIAAMSGNGFHLQFPVALPNDGESEALVKAILATVGDRFSDDAVAVDQVVFNAARICRLYGTPARKGDSTQERPHRMSEILHVPDCIEAGLNEVCSIEALQAVAALAPASMTKVTERSSRSNKASGNKKRQSKLLVGEYLSDLGLAFTEKRGGNGWTKYVLDCCPFNADHDNDSMLSQHDDGAIAFKCFHDGCANHDWQAFKAEFGKPGPEHYDPPLPAKHKPTANKPTRQVHDDSERTYDCADRNDIGNAAHFARVNADRLRYVHAWNKWLVWDGCRWKPDDDGTPIRLSKEIVREIFTTSLAWQDDVLREFANKSASGSRLREMVTLAAPELPANISVLDTNGWLLNCPNGTVDLRTGEISDHQRWQHITKLCPTEFCPDAEANTWQKFLNDVFVDPHLVGFVQRLLGYCLTGDVSEQKLPIFYGTGANGKSTLLNAFLDVVGPDYTMQSMPDFLMEKKGESHPTEKASLFGKRFVSCVETESSRRLAEATVKMLTGGEKIMARRMREDFWEFTPTHKLVLCTNHKPIVNGTDHGIWRRLLLVPFTQRFEGSRIDKQLPEKLRAESAGILAWLVRGCIDWVKDGLNPPAIVTSATNSYRSQENIIGRFIEDRCRQSNEASARFAALYEAYEGWAKDSGDFVMSKRKLGQWLAENGYEPFQSNGRCYRGLALKVDTSQAHEFFT